MLQTFRDRSGGLFIKILFGVLVASFALWGVGDVFRNFTTMRPLATVGKSSVSQEEFLHAYQRVLNNFQVISKGKVSIDEAKKMNIYQRVLDDLIDVRIVKETIQNLGLVVTDNAVRNHIQAMPAFKNNQGQFDKNKLDLIISNSGLTESTFIKEMREALLQQQLFGSLAAGADLPLAYQEKIFQGLHQQRLFTVVTVSLPQMSISQTPTEGELEQIYKENQALLSLPEYRQLSLMVVDPQIFRSRLKLEDTQLKEAYEARLETYKIPETRDVTQLLFTSKEDATAASKALNDGGNAVQLAKKYNAEIRQINQATPDKFIQDHTAAIFALPLGVASPSLDSALGYTVFVVTKITPERVQSLDEVKSKLEEELKVDQINDHLYEVRNKIEDALASGAKLSEIAKEQNLEIQSLPKIDKNGLDVASKAVLPAVYQSLILENAFNLAEGANSAMIDAADGTSIVVHVDSITPQTLPELSQIRDRVIATWREVKQQEKAADLAQKIVKEADSVAKLTQLAKQNGLAVKFLKPLNRVEAQKQQQPVEGISVNIIRQGFVLEPNKALYGPIENGFAIIMLDKVIPFDIVKEKEKFTAFGDSIKKMLQQDLQSSYTTYLRHHDKVSINEEILQKLVNHS